MQAKDTDPDPTPPAMDPIVHHLLKASLQQSQLSQEMVRGVHTATQKLLVLCQLALAVATPFPDPT